MRNTIAEKMFGPFSQHRKTSSPGGHLFQDEGTHTQARQYKNKYRVVWTGGDVNFQPSKLGLATKPTRLGILRRRAERKKKGCSIGVEEGVSSKSFPCLSFQSLWELVALLFLISDFSIYPK